MPKPDDPAGPGDGHALTARELIRRISTPGDVAAVALGFAVGLPIDYFLLHMGLPIGTVSSYTAATAFGFKKSFDAAMEPTRRRKEREQAKHDRKQQDQDERRDALQRARDVEQHFRSRQKIDVADAIHDLCDLYSLGGLQRREFDLRLRRIVSAATRQTSAASIDPGR